MQSFNLDANVALDEKNDMKADLFAVREKTILCSIGSLVALKVRLMHLSGLYAAHVHLIVM